LGYSVVAVEAIPQSAVYKSLATEYLFIISWAVLIFVAPLAKELFEVLNLKVIDGLTAEVF